MLLTNCSQEIAMPAALVIGAFQESCIPALQSAAVSATLPTPFVSVTKADLS